MTAKRQEFPMLAEPIEVMLARAADEIPASEGWRYEPKWDGFRCVAIRDGDTVRLQSRNRKLLQEAFPEVVAALRTAGAPRVLDGELMIGSEGDYADSFARLQLRAKSKGERLERLVAEQPVTFMVFDQLATECGRVLVDRPFDQRRAALEQAAAGWASPRLQLTPQTDRIAAAQRWMALAGAGIEGVVAKRGDAPYELGRRSHAMLKIKVQHSIDCVVGGIATEGHGTRVLLLGLYDDADEQLHYVGQSVPLPQRLMHRIEQVLPLGSHDGPSGFTGRQPVEQHRWRDQPRAPWRAVPPRVVVETAYDRLGTTFRHRPKVLRLREDKPPEACRFNQDERAG